MTVLTARAMATACLGLVGFVAVVTLVAAGVGGGFERTAIVFLISLVAVAGIGVYSGNSGILSFGHLSFMGVAAYASGILAMPVALKTMSLPNLPGLVGGTQLSFLAALAVAVLIAMAFALVVGVVIARLDGAAATIATLALLIITHGVIIGARDITRGSQSFFGVPRETTLLGAAVACAVALVIARLFRDSVPGLKLRAAREDAIAARAMGVGIRGERLLAWVLSAGLVAVSGVLLGHFLGAFSAKKFYFVDTFMLLAMLIVGGMSTVTGAVVGAVTITAVIEVLRRLEGGFELFGVAVPEFFGATQIGIGLAILFVMFRKSEGIAGLREWDERLFGIGTVAAAPEPAAAGGADGPATLAADGVSKRFAGLVAVDGVSLTLARGEILGLIGPNGSGKSTLLNMLTGVLPASGGHVRLDGRPVESLPGHRYAGLGIARTFQNIRLFKTLSVRQNVLVAALAGWPKVGVREAAARAERAIADVGIGALADRRADTLSYGDQRRVEIARALALEPAFLCLDEPAAGMNREETDALMESLRAIKERRRLGVLIVDHDLPLITRLCERVVVLNEGRLVAEGVPAAVQRDPAVVEAYLGRRHSREIAGLTGLSGGAAAQQQA